jgi:hypothetical protein
MKFIRTESHELINVDNLINLEIVEGDGANAEKETKTMYGIIATDILGKEHDVAIFEKSENAIETLEEIQNWLEMDKYAVYEIEEEENEK